MTVLTFDLSCKGIETTGLLELAGHQPSSGISETLTQAIRQREKEQGTRHPL